MTAKTLPFMLARSPFHLPLLPEEKEDEEGEEEEWGWGVISRVRQEE